MFAPAKVLPRVALLALAALLPLAAYAGDYRLTIGEQSVQILQQPQRAVVANGTTPAPTLYWREGEAVALTVTNNLAEPTSLHWHGIVLPYDMDGVPEISFPGIAPGASFTYRFPLRQHGTYWYHGHSGMQEQLGLFGALVIAPAHEQHKADRDYVVLLSDWPEADPDRTLARLKKQSDYYNFQKRTLGDFFNDLGSQGVAATLADRLAWGDMRMDPTDLADVTGATYHFLVNGQTPAQNWSALFQPGETVRLRIINASAMTHFDVSVPGLAMQVISADGQDVQPVATQQLRIAVAETYDVLLHPSAGQAYTFFAAAMDRSGYARATLAPHAGMTAALPPMPPRRLLTLAEMGPAHAGHDHAEMAPMGDTPMPLKQTQHDPASHDSQAEPSNAAGHEHGGHAAAAPNPHASHAGMDAHAHHDHMMMAAPSPAVVKTENLTYADLRAANPEAPQSKPDREITLRLTGNMNRYVWSFDEVKYSDAEPIRVRYGDHIRFTYINETMMHHPIHLHGLWQFLDNGNGAYNPKKHVINVAPGTTVHVDVVADALGEWAFHCHLLYHMDTGMFRKLVVEPKP